jgi:uncharacterized membrane protein YkvA (DUF1232 family)
LLAPTGATMEPLQRLRSWARSVKRDVVALYYAARDDRVPWYAKLAAAAVTAYALSPIDLIPDFVPVLGYLDDVVLVPLGIALAVRLIPPALFEEFRRMAMEREGGGPRSRVGAAAIVAVWVVLALASLAWLARRFAT